GALPHDCDDHPPWRGAGRDRPVGRRPVVRRLRHGRKRGHGGDTGGDRGGALGHLARDADASRGRPAVSVPALSEQFGQPIRGPRALDESWSRFWHLAYNIARSEFKLKFFGSALGYVWQV